MGGSGGTSGEIERASSLPRGEVVSEIINVEFFGFAVAGGSLTGGIRCPSALRSNLIF